MKRNNCMIRDYIREALSHQGQTFDTGASMMCWKLMVAFLTAVAASAAEPCPPLCICDDSTIECKNTGRIEPPAGFWAHIRTLDLDGNNISDLHALSFSGFPEVGWLYMPRNTITVLDLIVYTPMPRLTYLVLGTNAISSVLQPTSDFRLPSLYSLDLAFDKLTTLDPNMLAKVAPKLELLNLQNNPFVIPHDGPVFNHPKLRWLMLLESNATALSTQTFSGLPNMEVLMLSDSGVRNITGAFLSNPKLFFADFVRCDIKEVVAGTFASSRSLTSLFFSQNPLETLQLEAIEHAVKMGGTVFLTGTPLVCKCNHADIYRWAQQVGVKLQHACSGATTCTFPPQWRK